MAFISRWSQSLWTYVSPHKSEHARQPTAEIASQRNKAPLTKRRHSQLLRNSRSISPKEPLHDWSLDSPADSTTPAGGNKKKRNRSCTSATTASGHRRKARKLYHDQADSPDVDIDENISMDIEGANSDDDDNFSSEMSNILVTGTPIKQHDDDHALEDDDDDVDEESECRDTGDEIEIGQDQSEGEGVELENDEIKIEDNEDTYNADDFDSTLPEIDESFVVDEDEYASHIPSHTRKRKIDLPDLPPDITTKEELHADGWKGDHITLVHKIMYRGHEPILPDYFKAYFRNVPDTLFADDDSGFLAAMPGNSRMWSVKALNKLLELGPRIREAVARENYPPEKCTERKLMEYTKWASRNSGLDVKRIIPIIATVYAQKNSSPETMQHEAIRKLRKLAARYTEALHVETSIEVSPSSTNTTKLATEIPTLYAIIASHTIIALIAYRVELDTGFLDPAHEQEGNDGTKVVAYFDMSNKNHDVWNCYALAILIVHARNVQLRIANETGVGVKSVGDDESDDPDA
ncbi:Hypothetical protein R9X50_00730500 [Acrodontium crateriforme]|uniref:Uncharacterized protein n=1 Tax=Acrodontium crateriforme TaxID=150365 RepID=A0AAQ3M9Y5_9PEZI|nr:Hypothetical protein R9X50_00730500 [Acrodontium crateriforme]